MTRLKNWGITSTARQLFTASLLVFSVLGSMQAQALVISVQDGNGNAVTGFRYLVEHDTSHPVTPGAIVSNSLSLGIHRSHSPIAMLNGNAGPAQGHVNGSLVELDLRNDVRYFVSILPDAGYSNSGAHVGLDQDLVNVTVNPVVKVNALPLPTAQISVLVFEDNSPLNTLADLPNERGLAGFSIYVDDPAGQLITDAFGNPLGTTYQTDANGNAILDAEGSPVVNVRGSGVVLSDANGEALIKYLAPGKYGLRVVSPAGWIQTNTIEGTHTIDAWVRAGEPPQLGAFGPPNKHVWFGFIREHNALPAGGTGTVTGRIVNAHNSTPPDFSFNAGHPIPGCWVGLNKVESKQAVLAQPCNDDSSFVINNVPAGDYQLAIWDKNLDVIFALQGISVAPGGSVLALGDIPVFRWFGYLQSYVFYDRNQNGFRDCATPSCSNFLTDDIGIPEQAVNLRFRDGSLYQTFPTDLDGYVPFEEVFPFLKFLVAEVDYTRFKATGATVVTDGGGPVLPDLGWDWPSRGWLNPQPQCESRDQLGNCINPVINPNTGNNLSRTVTGPVLTLATQAFIGLTNIIEWGKAPYARGENGGISGIVYYATTRAEADPRNAAAESWEPGIPWVQVALYQDADWDNIIDDLNGDGSVTLSDVDSYPQGNFPGPEDVDRNGNLVFDGGDAVQVTTTDSWDDNMPTGCQAPPFSINGGPAQDCFEGLRTFNQVRDGIFDGGYIFTSYHPGGIDSGSAEQTLPAGRYIVEAATAAGYTLLKEEDKNVDFGDEYIPSPQLLPPQCVGQDHLVPAELSLFPGIPAPFAGQIRPLCDRKVIVLSDRTNAAVDFYQFTEVPKAARVVGFLLNDFANVFDPNHPSFGEKAAPPWISVSIKDHAGNEVARTYSDEFGTYNAIVPSTYTVNIPSPTGVSPNMLRVCLNDPGPIPNPQNKEMLITDPRFDPQYTQVCYTADFWPGKTTYLDTPVLPVAATAGRTDYPLDCELAAGDPQIYSVSGPTGGPWISATGQAVTLTSSAWDGPDPALNPAYEAGTGTPQNVLREHGFGNVPGTVTLNGVPVTVTTWEDVSVTAIIPAGSSSGELLVTRGDNGRTSRSGVTLHIGGPAPRRVALGGSIQAAIDAATPGELILVPPGTYNELLVINKPVRLQGWGAGSTLLDAGKSPALTANWTSRVNALVAAGAVDLIPGQAGLSNLEEGPGITVLAKAGDFALAPSVIDGFTITKATTGGGILVNAHVTGLVISNNRISDGQGTYGGGIRIGQPYIDNGGIFVYTDAHNDNIAIHHNEMIRNGSKSQAGGGIALYTGSDNYAVTDNFICGNFSAQDGAGIGHSGLSNQGVIAGNTIVFNQVFQQTAGAGGAGGGIFVAGGKALAEGQLSPGSGNVLIDGNLILGNQAGADDGGGIMLRYINGQDTAGPINTWYNVSVQNNTIVNNVSALAGAVALQDALMVDLFNNVIANNDSTATSASAFSAGPSQSSPQPAGVVSRVHTAALATAISGSGLPAFSDPSLIGNTIWHNRSFYWDVNANNAQGGLVPDIAAGTAPVFHDLAVLGTAGSLNPLNGTLTDTAGYDASNSSADPGFAAEYYNGGPSYLLKPGVVSNIQTIPAFDEGGNFIDLSMGPLTLRDPATGQLFGQY